MEPKDSTVSRRGVLAGGVALAAKAGSCGHNPTPRHPDANFVDGFRAVRAPDGLRCKT